MKLTEVIRRPLVTEKTTTLRDDGKTVVFEVAKDASKIDIKRAIEKLLGAKVATFARRSPAASDARAALSAAVRTGRRPTSRCVPARSCLTSSRGIKSCRSVNTSRLPGRRQMTVLTFDEITTDTPHAPLTEKLQPSGGRSSTGEQTIWWRGGGPSRLYRIIDFKRDKAGIPGKVSTIGITRIVRRASRSSRMPTARSATSCSNGLKVGDSIIAGENVDILTGNCLPLKNIPLGTMVHNVELKPGEADRWRSAAPPCRSSPRKAITSR